MLCKYKIINLNEFQLNLLLFFVRVSVNFWKVSSNLNLLTEPAKKLQINKTYS